MTLLSTTLPPYQSSCCCAAREVRRRARANPADAASAHVAPAQTSRCAPRAAHGRSGRTKREFRFVRSWSGWLRRRRGGFRPSCRCKASSVCASSEPPSSLHPCMRTAVRVRVPLTGIALPPCHAPARAQSRMPSSNRICRPYAPFSIRLRATPASTEAAPALRISPYIYASARRHSARAGLGVHGFPGPALICEAISLPSSAGATQRRPLRPR